MHVFVECVCVCGCMSLSFLSIFCGVLLFFVFYVSLISSLPRLFLLSLVDDE